MFMMPENLIKFHNAIVDIKNISKKRHATLVAVLKNQTAVVE